ncbi:class III extradiol dioxygenase subunit B-like domain-containing protein [Streptomyces sulfonofaciens]|uniref:class III extradiol dioxygenase subunit B-like domain-containing protein n=1 Tax=Streptomyces sulfonofaciens TaxID=68272 RepID=UPI0016736028|nr:class III extradiol dioxygenase subunit B-like domain-containing protein [Streptomyces sulfonofaciens]
MLVAAAVCPCPPLLVPEVAAGAAPELDAARDACAEAVAVLAASRPDRLVVVGPVAGADRTPFPTGTPGSFQGFGVDLGVRLGAPEPDGARADRVLPASLAVAAWLLGHAQWPSVPVSGLGVGDLLGTERCVSTGAEITAGPERVALLAMGDGSACRSLKAPGYLDARAAGFDAAAARALAAADAQALRAVDEELARQVQAAGRAPWQVLAGAAEGSAENPALKGALLYDDAPYGVGYLVATWA